MENKNIKNVVMSSLYWKLLERFGVQGSQFVLQIILARLLMPEDYGLIAIISIFITLSNVFIQRGFSTALIQKRDSDEQDFNSVFTISIIISVFLYLILYLSAPTIANFYDEFKLTAILRVLSISLFIGSISSLQNAYIAKNFMFKIMFKSSITGTIISGMIGIIMAYKGAGAWALVVQQLTNQILIVIVIWKNIKWMPKIKCTLSRLKILFQFGWKLMVSSLIETMYNELSGLIVGKIYNPAMLGYFNRGKQFPSTIVTNIDGSIQAVIFPTLSKYQDDRKRLKELVRKSIVTSSFIIFPIMIGLAVTSETLIKIILTEKWIPAVPFLQIFCAIYALYPIHTINLQAINAIGRSDIYLKLEILKKVIGFVILIISVRYGVFGITFGILITGLISTFINSFPNKKLFDYGYSEQLKDLLPSIILSFAMGAGVYFIGTIKCNSIVQLFIQVVFGIIFYLLFAYLLKYEVLTYILFSINEILTKKRR